MAITPLNDCERLDFAVKIARDAGLQTLFHFGRANLDIEHKPDGTPVTLADREAEEYLRQQISQHYSKDGILGEELGNTEGSSGYCWVLDPIDGTKSFIHGIPLYTTLVALLYADQPLIGVIFAPATREMLYAQTGNGCWYEVDSHSNSPSRERAQVSHVTKLSDALFVTSDVESYANDRTINASGVYHDLASRCRLTRTWGDGYGYLLVATGRAEVMIDPEMSLWDSACLQPIITEAGGSFTDWQGKPSIHSGDVVATNAALAEQVLAITQGR